MWNLVWVFFENMKFVCVCNLILLVFYVKLEINIYLYIVWCYLKVLGNI